MSEQMFILKDELYQNGMFPKIPEHHKRGSWFLLTDGINDDIIVSDNTTVRQIRQGKYKRLVEISQNSFVVEHEFDSSCKETTYTFNVKVKAKVYVSDPIEFYSNNKSIDIRAFFNNQFSLDVGRITRKYSILDYNGIDDELISALTSNQVTDILNAGLSYQISTVVTQPNEAAKKILKEIDDMNIRKRTTAIASSIAGGNKNKTYSDAIWEEAAKGNISDTEAIEKIEEYNKKSNEEKLETIKDLLKEGLISETISISQAQSLLPYQQTEKTDFEPFEETSQNDVFYNSIDELYPDEE